jgi:hypothetical protein
VPESTEEYGRVQEGRRGCKRVQDCAGEYRRLKYECGRVQESIVVSGRVEGITGKCKKV